MVMILTIIGALFIICLMLFFVGGLTLTMVSAIFSMATVAFFPITALVFLLWLLTDSLLLSLLLTVIFGFVVMSLPDKNANA